MSRTTTVSNITIDIKQYRAINNILTTLDRLGICGYLGRRSGSDGEVGVGYWGEFYIENDSGVYAYRFYEDRGCYGFS